MIASVTFDDTLPVSLNHREARFEVSGGWTITESAHGRVELRHADYAHAIVSQGLPYTLHLVADPVPVVRGRR